MTTILFKLIYNKSIDIYIPENIKVNQLNNYIKPTIKKYFNINNFDIIDAKNPFNEEGEPIYEENINFHDKFKNDVFYIKPKNNNAIECTICLETHTNYRTLLCSHQFCNLCINSWFSWGNNTCPLCRNNI